MSRPIAFKAGMREQRIQVSFRQASKECVTVDKLPFLICYKNGHGLDLAIMHVEVNPIPSLPVPFAWTAASNLFRGERR
jgi:hypothetical protein